jgi:hypothetical protein
MAKKKLPKGSPLRIVKTRGREAGKYDLYNLEGLSLGMVMVLGRAVHALAALADDPIAEDLLPIFDHVWVDGVKQPMDTMQTMTE